MRKLTKKIVCGGAAVAAVAIMLGVFVGRTMLNKAAENEVSKSNEGEVVTVRDYCRNNSDEIGWTYNVANGDNFCYDIFDYDNEEFQETKILITPVDKINIEEIKGTNIKELYDKKMNSIENDDKVYGDDMSMWLDIIHKYSDKEYLFFREWSTRYTKSNIKWMVSEGDYSKFLKKEFVTDLMTEDAISFFDCYGTHFLTEVNNGAYLGDQIIVSTNDRDVFDKINGLVLNDENSNKEYERYACELRVDKGALERNVASNVYNTEYEIVYDEEEFIERAKENPGVVSMDKNSLKPIWLLLDGLDKNTSYTVEQINKRRTELENAYNKYLEQKKEEYMHYID